MPAGSLSYLEALTRGRHSEQQQRSEVPPAPSSSFQLSSEEQLLLIGQDQASRPAGGGGGGSRGRSVSFSLPSSAASPLPASPPRWREHASEAGSPTLEQVLLMSRHSPGTPSPADDGYGSLTMRERPGQVPRSQLHPPLRRRLPCHRPWQGSRWRMSLALMLQFLRLLKHSSNCNSNKQRCMVGWVVCTCPSTTLTTQTRWAITKVEQCWALS